MVLLCGIILVVAEVFNFAEAAARRAKAKQEQVQVLENQLHTPPQWEPLEDQSGFSLMQCGHCGSEEFSVGSYNAVVGGLICVKCGKAAEGWIAMEVIDD